jgi:hypothetical protein
MNTTKLVGRYTAGTGVMEEISVGSGLTLTGAGVLNNTATPTPTGYYGAWQDLTTQTAAVSNTGYAMKFGTIDFENQVRIVTDGSNLTRITFDNTGIYNLNFSVQIQNTDNAEHDVTIWLRKNGVDVLGSAGYVTVPKRRSTGAGLEGHTIAGWNYMLNPVGGDYFQIMWSTTEASVVTLQFYAAGSPPPSTASTLAIVTQQSGIMAGTGITAINSLTGAVQTIGVGTSGTDFAVSSSGTAHTLNLPTASATNRGALSSADWSTFNGKQNAVAFTTAGTNIATIPNPSATTYVRINADNTVSAVTLPQLKQELGVSRTVLTSGVSNSDAAGGWADVTGLSFPVLNGSYYRFKFFIIYAVNNVTTGTRWSINGPTNTVLGYRAMYSGTTVANITTNNAVAYDNGTASASSPFTSGNTAIIEGLIRPSANGTVIARFAPEISAGVSVAALVGSYVEYEQVI